MLIWFEDFISFYTKEARRLANPFLMQILANDGRLFTNCFVGIQANSAVVTLLTYAILLARNGLNSLSNSLSTYIKETSTC